MMVQTIRYKRMLKFYVNVTVCIQAVCPANQALGTNTKESTKANKHFSSTAVQTFSDSKQLRHAGTVLLQFAQESMAYSDTKKHQQTSCCQGQTGSSTTMHLYALQNNMQIYLTPGTCRYTALELCSPAVANSVVSRNSRNVFYTIHFLVNRRKVFSSTDYRPPGM